MAEVTISRTDGGSGPVAPNTKFRLQGSVIGGSATAWRWQLKGADVGGATSSELECDANAETVGSYVAIATVDGRNVNSRPFEVALAPLTEPGRVGEPPAPTEPPPEFHAKFAGWSASVVIVLTAIVLWRPTSAAWHVGKSDWKGDDGHLQLAASLAVPLTVLGGAAVAAGAWMAVVEWRGRFQKKEPASGDVRKRGVDVDAGKVIEAIGKLRGAALVMIVGGLLMLGSAWIAQASAKQPSPTTGTQQGQGTTNAPPASPTPPATPTPSQPGGGSGSGG